MTPPPAETTPLSFGDMPLRIEDVVAIARRRRGAALSKDASFRARITRGTEFLDRLLREDGVVYGVTTGYGDSCTVVIPPDLLTELPHHLFTYHGCGLGRFLDADETRAVLAARLASLSVGMSGVSLPLLEGLVALLQHDILPLIPAEGSVGGGVVEEHWVTIVGRRPAPSRRAAGTSGLYSRNLYNLLSAFWNAETKTLALPDDDEIVKGARITHGGKVVSERLLG